MAAASSSRRGLAGAAHVVGVDQQRGDVLVLRRRADRVGEVPQQRLRRLLALGLVDGALERLAGELLDDVALRAG